MQVIIFLKVLQKKSGNGGKDDLHLTREFENDIGDNNTVFSGPPKSSTSTRPDIFSHRKCGIRLTRSRP